MNLDPSGELMLVSREWARRAGATRWWQWKRRLVMRARAEQAERDSIHIRFIRGEV